jgi:hypothetical protein
VTEIPEHLLARADKAREKNGLPPHPRGQQEAPRPPRPSPARSSLPAAPPPAPLTTLGIPGVIEVLHPGDVLIVRLPEDTEGVDAICATIERVCGKGRTLVFAGDVNLTIQRKATPDDTDPPADVPPPARHRWSAGAVLRLLRGRQA